MTYIRVKYSSIKMGPTKDGRALARFIWFRISTNGELL
jgi:hypothetical protein